MSVTVRRLKRNPVAQRKTVHTGNRSKNGQWKPGSVHSRAIRQKGSGRGVVEDNPGQYTNS